MGTLSELLPDEIRTYYEPFLGGGALYFHLAQQERFRQAVLNDYNAELVNCYRVVHDSVNDLIAQLGALEVHKAVFDHLRSSDPTEMGPVARAARLIYLNKTAFNGLYRVNKQGGFNVPWGSYDNPRVLDEGNLRDCSRVLKGSTQLWTLLLEGDFAAAVQNAGPGDVVYFDPPYVPLSPTSSFKDYTKDGFTLTDQQRLALCVRDLAKKGALVLLSNSDTPTVRELYEGLEILDVRMRRNISSKGDGRGPVSEVIVVARPDAEATPAP